MDGVDDLQKNVPLMSVNQPRQQRSMEKVLRSRNPATLTDAGLWPAFLFMAGAMIHFYFENSLASSQPPSSVTVITTTTICHYHHHNHHHLSLSSSQPPPSVTIIITATTIGHNHHHSHHHLSPLSSQPPPSLTIIIITTEGTFILVNFLQILFTLTSTHHRIMFPKLTGRIWRETDDLRRKVP